MSTNDYRFTFRGTEELLNYNYAFPPQEGENIVQIVLKELELDSKSYAAFVAPGGSKFDLIYIILLICTRY